MAIILAIALLSIQSPVTYADDSTLSTHSDATIIECDDSGTDTDADGIYDYLTVKVKVEVYTHGKYKIFGRMLPPMPDIKAYNSKTLEPGIHVIEIDFDGAEIYSTGINGPYAIDIRLYKSSCIEVITYTTNYYDFEDFKPRIERVEEALIEITENTITLKTAILIAIVNISSPKITFYYIADENGKRGKFKVEFRKIIGYNDDGDGIYSPELDVLKYEGELTHTPWLFRGEIDGGFCFNISNTISLKSTVNADEYVDVDVIFRYAKSYRAVDAEQKFDIIIKPHANIDVDHIAIEQILTDEVGVHYFELNDLVSPTKISFMDSEGKEHGYYAWSDTAAASATGHHEQATIINVSASCSILTSQDVRSASSKEAMVLYLSYAYKGNEIEINHDPIVGVNPSNVPIEPVIEGIKKVVEFIKHHPLIYVISASVGIVIVGSTFYRAARKKT
jgi:hypothetical protein